MRIYSHFSVDTLSNTYLVGFPSGNAVLIDPSVFDGHLLELIEHNSYALTCVFVTHADETHVAGLRTILKVYDDVRICAGVQTLMDVPTKLVTPGQRLDIHGTPADVIALPGAGRDSVAYYMAGFLFTGTAMSAGEAGAVSNPYAKAMLLADVGRSILTLPGETVVFPFYGPPSTVAVERRVFPMEDPIALAGLS